MTTAFWAAVHGGATHFPIALLIASFLFDAIACLARRDPLSRDLHAASFYAIILGALASVAAVFSGLIISGWAVLGSGTLAMHHRFVWPSFAAIIGLAAWRLVVREKASRGAFGLYLIIAFIAACGMALAGYWGSRMQGG